MDCRNFLQFEIIKPERLVKQETKPEAPPAAPAEAKKPPEAPKPTFRPAEEGAANARRARETGDEENRKSNAQADAQLNQATTAADEAQKRQEAEETLKLLAEKYKVPSAKDEAEARQNLLKSITDEKDKQKLTWALQIIDQEKPAEEDSDKTSDALKGMGIGALLERLVDKLTKLFDKLSVQIEKMFGSFEKKTAKILSPLGGDKKITIAKDYKAGQGITIAANANAEIYSVGSGTITNIDRNTNAIEIIGPDGKSKIIYKNVIPDSSLKTGDEATKIEPGKQFLLGKAASGSGISFQYFDSNGTEQNPTENFKKAELIEEETKPEEPASGPTATTDSNADAKPADTKPKT